LEPRQRQTKIKTSEIRHSFLDYFQKHDHRLVDSSPVVPFEDPSILFINAGMNQFKDIFTGRRKPDFPRATSSQKCIRAGGKHNDLDNVGFTARHHTFFEMLGNFSFGDYFKEEAIKLAWEWVTKDLRLPVDRLYATVYNDDDQAFSLWEKVAPELAGGRVMRFGKKDNYWSMGDIGPCGPCSEIHFDRGEKYGTGPEDKVNGETDRFVEIWNLVFMQFEQTPDGNLINLPKPSVDTGAGLERIAAIMQNCDTNYGIDLFQNLIKAISDLTGAKYKDNATSHNVVADHIRALTFAIADGAGISNEGRGYVLRRILRRAARHGRELGAKEPFLYRLVPTLVNEMGETFPEIREKQDFVTSVIKAEEESFARTLDTGLELFGAVAKEVTKRGGKVVPGGDVFKLYDTYGFPYDLTEVLATEQGLTLDREGFDTAMVAQQERSRAGGNFTGFTLEASKKFIDDFERKGIASLPHTEFVRKIPPVVKTRILKATALPFPEVGVILAKSPFYVESGGQVGDEGRIAGKHFEIRVSAVVNRNGHLIHLGTATAGRLTDIFEADSVTAEVDAPRRWDIMRNHTATHLAHAALRKVLGDHVKQSGSYVGPDRLRFDFSHHQPMTPQEIAEVERLVNEQILLGPEVNTVEMPVDEAKKMGAMALFGEKYGDTVRVVSVGKDENRFSLELCGGTHVQNVSQIGPFFITLETGIASGVRRMEAITGREAQKKMLAQKEALLRLSQLTNRLENEVILGVEQLRSENSSLQKEIKKLKTELVSGAGQSVGTEQKLGDLTLWTHDFGETDRESMSAWIDSKKEQPAALVALALGIAEGKPTVMLAISNAAVKQKSLHAGNMLKDLLSAFGGRGGGKPAFAQGGYPEGLSAGDVFDKARALLT
jgi:alanyl-tRNA synthetase